MVNARENGSTYSKRNSRLGFTVLGSKISLLDHSDSPDNTIFFLYRNFNCTVEPTTSSDP
jgi:hypothetical protein